MECALFRKDYDSAWRYNLCLKMDWLFMECALFRKDYDIFEIFVNVFFENFMECALFRKDYDIQ
jgi:hypothetical protein